MFIGKYNKSLVISYVGVICTVMGMFFACTPTFGGETNFKVAMIFLILAGVCDMLDGKFARMCKRDKDEEMFGIQLDSLADVVDFVCFPIVFGLAKGFNSWYHVITYVLIAMAGIQRLCYFNVLVINKKDKGPVKYYTGLPVTATAVIFPIVYAISRLVESCLFNEIFYAVITFLTAFFFVSNIKVPKPKGIAYPIFGAIAVVGIVIICLV